MNLQVLKNQKGFTIVELLIVIVVIGILAAITIVAYNGIQNRAYTTAGQSLAGSVAKKLEAYNSVVGAYPTTRTQLQGTAESKVEGLPTVHTTAASSPIALPASDSLFNGVAWTAGSSGLNGKAVRIVGSATGGTVIYWDYARTTPGQATISYGAGS